MEATLCLSLDLSDNPVTFQNPRGEICGIAGVSRTDAHCGAIWMLTTPYVRPYPKLFFKEAKKWVEQQTSYEMLHNIADPRNHLHMKLLHMLGFKKLMYVTTQTNLTYVEFAKLTKSCVLPAYAIVGIATGLISAVQSIAGYQAQSQAASASEKAYQEQRNLNQEAANRAYQQTQLKMKGEMEKASQQAEKGLVRRLQAQGTTLAAGRAGQSIGGLLADAERVEGKDLGALGMNLAYAQQDYFFGMENIYTQQKRANVSAASQRVAKPSGAGLALGLAGSALSGVQAGMALKAPAAGGGVPKPTQIPGAALPGGRAGTVIRWS
jgi:hypothetical protein